MEILSKDIENEYEELNAWIEREKELWFSLKFHLKMFQALLESNVPILEGSKKQFRSIEKDLDIIRCKIVRRINSLKVWDSKNYSSRMSLYGDSYLDSLRKAIQDYRCYSI